MRSPSLTLGQVRTFGRYATGIRAYLTERLTAEQCRANLEQKLRDREANFLDLLRRAVFDLPSSPYRPLAAHLDIELEDVRRLLREVGVEPALEQLHTAGFHVRLDEFKGKAPIERPGGLSYEVPPDAWDNPLFDPVVQARTGGSTGIGRAVHMDFGHLRQEVDYLWLFLHAFEAASMPQTMWRPVPPGSAGLGHALGLMKLGIPLDSWFTQSWPPSGVAGASERLLLGFTRFAARRWGTGIGHLEHVPVNEPEAVAHHLARLVDGGTPAMINAPVSSAVRLAVAAGEASLDLTGTLVRSGGEPLTRARAEAITASGARVTPTYAMAEMGRIGIGCADPTEVDDVHLLTDKVAAITRAGAAGTTSEGVSELWLTSLHPSCRKVMVNVDVGDHATVTDRRCSCGIGALGYARHLHGIGSHEKLTSEGMNFLGADLVRLVEEVLPHRVGGAAGDFQIVEDRDGPTTTVTVVVHPRVGPVVEDEVVDLVLDVLGRGPSYRRMMTTVWRDGAAVRVARREPHTTSAGKVPSFWLVRP